MVTGGRDVSGSEGRDPIADFDAINEELRQYSPELATRPQIVVANKTDLLADPAQLDAFRAHVEEAGYAFMQVKTVQMGKYAEYDATNRFYLAMGFKEFEVFPHLWDEWNPCQVYVMGL